MKVTIAPQRCDRPPILAAPDVEQARTGSLLGTRRGVSQRTGVNNSATSAPSAAPATGATSNPTEKTHSSSQLW